MSTNYPYLKFREKCCALGAVLLLGFGGLQAQEAILAADCEALGSGGSISYSVGQVLYSSNTGTNGIVAQGDQQFYEIITESVGTGDIDHALAIYPNLITDFLTLQVENTQLPNLQLQLLDVMGRLIESRRITGDKNHIMMGHLASAPYTLKIADINTPTETKIFKIIKN